MQLIKRLLIIIFVLVILGCGLIWADNHNYLSHPVFAKVSQLIKKIPLQNLAFLQAKKNQTNNENLNKISQDVEEQAKILGQRAQETGQHVQQVLGTSIKVNETESGKKPLSTQALEYGRYIYCKSVVDDWEKQQATQSSQNDN